MIWARATMLVGNCSHHCFILLPRDLANELLQLVGTTFPPRIRFTLVSLVISFLCLHDNCLRTEMRSSRCNYNSAFRTVCTPSQLIDYQRKHSVQTRLWAILSYVLRLTVCFFHFQSSLPFSGSVLSLFLGRSLPYCFQLKLCFSILDFFFLVLNKRSTGKPQSSF